VALPGRVQIPYSSQMPCFQIKISGLVQGVFFRHSAKAEAEKIGIVGYTKNLDDGSVEIVACLPTGDGDQDKIDEFIKWCRHGPALAQVEKVEMNEIPYREFKDFQIL
jgi:acylphosphatase